MGGTAAVGLAVGLGGAGGGAGKLVLAGLRGDEQFEHSNSGHVVVVVDGLLAHDRYPSAYWGRLGGGGARFETVN
jgi:hypothetical protein